MRIGIGRLPCLTILISIACLGAPIPIFNTGTLDSGAVGALGSEDLHYSLLVGQDLFQPVFLSNPPNILWLPNTASSAWLDNTGDRVLGETDVYVTFFDLTGLDLTTAILYAYLAVDNNLLDVRLNGSSLGISLGGTVLSNFQQLNPLPVIDHGFVGGLNRLEFVLNNFGGSASDGGFRLEINGTAEAIPEPGCLLLAATGLIMVALLRRRLKLRHRERAGAASAA